MRSTYSFISALHERLGDYSCGTWTPWRPSECDKFFPVQRKFRAQCCDSFSTTTKINVLHKAQSNSSLRR